ncbi:MAG: hypothetical protein KF817_13505, partial [Phycisphaeraceae bacterium]|nr:hypothetical protein [Phycisphaeraceae bacterium]
ASPGGGGGAAAGGGAGPGAPITHVPPLLIHTERSVPRAAFHDHVIAELAQYGAEMCIILYQYNGDAEQSGTIDLALLAERTAQRIPAGYTGFAMLDFEKPYMAWLWQPEDSQEYQQAVTQLLAAMTTVRAVRPQAKWTFYGIPRLPLVYARRPPAQQADWIARAKRPQALFDASDWISPCVYSDVWPAAQPETDREAHRTFVYASTVISHEVGGGKPVIPMIWHRVFDINPVNRLKLFSPAHFIEDQVTPALAGGANAISWWGADFHHWRSGALQYRSPEEFNWTNTESIDFPYLDGLHIERGRLLLETVLPGSVPD